MAEFKRGWTAVLAGFFGMATCAWVLPFYVLGPLIKPIEAEFGWSRVEIMAAATFINVGLLIATPITGRLVDRWGARPVTFVCLAVAVLCTAAMYKITDTKWLFYGFAFLAGFFGSGCGTVPYTRMVAGWFDKARGLVLGIVLSGTGLGGILGPWLVAHAVNAGNWRLAFLYAACLMALGLLSVLFLLKSQPPATAAVDKPAAHHTSEAPGMTRAEAIRDPRFLVMVLVFGILGTMDSGMILQLSPLLSDSGYSTTRTAATVSLLGVAMVASRLGVGWLLDRYSPHIVGACVLFATASGYIAFLFDRDIMGPVLVLSVGLIVGVAIQLMSFLTLKYFGIANYGSIYGLLFSILIGTTLVSPVAVGLIFTKLGPETGLICASLIYAVLGIIVAIGTKIAKPAPQPAT